MVKSYHIVLPHIEVDFMIISGKLIIFSRDYANQHNYEYACIMAQPMDQDRQDNLAKMALRRKMLIEIEHIILEDYSYEEEILNLMDDYDRICDRGGKKKNNWKKEQKYKET